MTPNGCCTDSPGCQDIATSRQVYLTLTWVFGGAYVVAVLLHLIF